VPQLQWFSPAPETDSAAYLEGTKIHFDAAKPAEVPEFFSYQTDELPLSGVHNYQNVMAATLAAVRVGIAPDKILDAIKSFENVPHRLQRVGVYEGVSYINDSKATNVDSVRYALGAFESPIIWIAGGIDKGNDYSLLSDLVRNRVKLLVILGEHYQNLEAAFSGTVAILRAATMHDAVRISAENAAPGDVVLLSPACASFDLFKNYEHRGQVFIDEFNALAKY
jgi:UDP-N-acetylmuramoylalanine--D-glutamate ligase